MPLDVGISQQRLRTGEDGVRVVLPVLHRHRRAGPVLESLRASERDVPLRPLFVLSFGDIKQLRTVEKLETDFIVLYEGRRPGDYARKINTGAALTEEPWIFTGADDVHFHEGWADIAIAFAGKSKLRAVGVNDLGRWSSRHREPPATHFLVHRYYWKMGTASESHAIFHTGYDHTYVDTEFMETAKARGQYGYCRESVVEHLHPVWRKGRRDEVYQLGTRRTKEDYRLYLSRRGLWRT